MTHRGVASGPFNVANIKIPEYFFQPLWHNNTGQLSAVCESYCRDARTLLSSGVPEREILGPEEVFIDLVYRRREVSDPHLVSYWACELCALFTELQGWHKLATIGFMTRLMKVRPMNLCPAPEGFPPPVPQNNAAAMQSNLSSGW